MYCHSDITTVAFKNATSSAILLFEINSINLCKDFGAETAAKSLNLPYLFLLP